jgi:hypothetical protein
MEGPVSRERSSNWQIWLEFEERTLADDRVIEDEESASDLVKSPEWQSAFASVISHIVKKNYWNGLKKYRLSGVESTHESTIFELIGETYERYLFVSELMIKRYFRGDPKSEFIGKNSLLVCELFVAIAKKVTPRARYALEDNLRRRSSIKENASLDVDDLADPEGDDFEADERYVHHKELQAKLLEDRLLEVSHDVEAHKIHLAFRHYYEFQFERGAKKLTATQIAHLHQVNVRKIYDEREIIYRRFEAILRTEDPDYYQRRQVERSHRGNRRLSNAVAATSKK